MSINKLWNLLVIDNDETSVQYLKSMLTNSTYNIVVSKDAKESFDLLTNDPNKFSAIILGQQINNGTNVEFLHQINSSSTLKTIPVIMEAHTGTIEEMELCIRAGARYYLPKPIDKKILPQIISTAIRDQERYHIAEQSISNAKPLNVLTEATFKIQTLHDAQNLAALLANECPSPNLAAVGINEILINAIEHGNLGITYNEKTQLDDNAAWIAEIGRRLTLPENKDKFGTVKFSKTPSHINIRISDEGNGFDWRQYQTLDKDRVLHNHGRGIIMARNLSFETMIYHGNGNDVECIIPLEF